jgi:aspartate carbamoyltransferase catalytic subunit
MTMKNFVSITDFSRQDILDVLERAARFEQNKEQQLLKGKIVATLFFEPSTRTRLSFETATHRLGGCVVGFSDASNTSITKGETLKDTIMMVANYADLIVMRHSLEGAARYAAEISKVPVINAGDGANQHPTQTLLDMYSIQKTQGSLDHIHIAMVGDLKYGRTVHSLLQAMIMFNARFTFIAPPELALPQEYKNLLIQNKISFEEYESLADHIQHADIIYMTRVQRERFDPMDYERVKNVYSLHNAMLENTKPNMKILHPLPRVNEIATDVDNNPKAYYYQQAENGVYARMATIAKLLNH